jgi:7,8-dihydropterin-6-yl-methyl-4-(beta-D-ribofuranosyl)aminobenzene 5'-phosphate synthase
MAPILTPAGVPGPVTLTIVFDNNPHLPGLQTEWGFACLVEAKEETVLFDTGSIGAMLLQNMQELDKDPLSIDYLVLSHEHYDHIGGLEALLGTGVRPTTFIPEAFGDDIRSWLRKRDVPIVEVGSQPTELLPGIYSTGYFRAVAADVIIEQGMLVETPRGWAMVTGCSHPGIVKMCERSTRACGSPLCLVVGGFHLANYNAARLQGIAGELAALGVQRIAPVHCSGDRTRDVFASSFGDQYLPMGVGASVVLTH